MIPQPKPSASSQGAGWRAEANAAQSNTAAAEAQEPGAGRSQPTPKKVATMKAHAVRCGDSTDGGGLSVLMRASATVRARAAQVLEYFRVEHWRTDLVDAGGPFAQVDLAAAIAAEWEILVPDANQGAARGAAERFWRFFSGGHSNSATTGTYEAGRSHSIFFNRCSSRLSASFRAVVLAELVLAGSSPMRIKP